MVSFVARACWVYIVSFQEKSSRWLACARSLGMLPRRVYVCGKGVRREFNAYALAAVCSCDKLFMSEAISVSR